MLHASTVNLLGVFCVLKIYFLYIYFFSIYQIHTSLLQQTVRQAACNNTMYSECLGISNDYK